MCTKTMGKVECVVCFCVTVVCVCVWLLNEHKRHIKCMTKEEFTMMVAADRDNRKKYNTNTFPKTNKSKKNTTHHTETNVEKSS